jgi:hypothetical protein
MKNTVLEIDSEIAKEFLLVLVKNSKFHFLNRIFDHISDIKFDNNEIRFKVLMFKYFLKIKTYPKTLSGKYEFLHNIPTKMIKKEEIPDFIELDEKKLIINFSPNPITRNISIDELKIQNGKLVLILGLV